MNRKDPPPTAVFPPPAGAGQPVLTCSGRLDLRPGQMLGGWEVLRLIGRGGEGAVWHMRHRPTGIDMALKAPISALRGGLSAASLQALSHPNIVAFRRVIRLMGRPAAFMDYVDGENVADIIEAGRLYEGGADNALMKILDIMIQAAKGLEYIHGLGLLHGDIKPANLLLEKGGRLLLADFTPIKNFPGPLPGTREYFSPERAENIESGSSSDLWALALSGLECFMGRRPWAAGSISGYGLNSYLAEDWAVPIPPFLAGFFRRALAGDMAARHQDAAEMAGELKGMRDKIITAYSFGGLK